VRMMDSIISQTEADPYYRDAISASRAPASNNSPDAIGAALSTVTGILHAPVTVAYTSTGSSALSMARQRPEAPIIGMTPRLSTARRLALVWGIHAVVTAEVADVTEMTDHACQAAREQGFAKQGDTVVITSGLPFATPGATNILRIAQIS
jgi:pyruvate kinase